jgi:hypothetical protein
MIFPTHYHALGAQIVLTNLAQYLHVKSYGIRVEEATLHTTLDAPVIAVAESHPDWQHLEAIGRYRALKDLLDEAASRFETAEDKANTVAEIIAEVDELIAPLR